MGDRYFVSYMHVGHQVHWRPDASIKLSHKFSYLCVSMFASCSKSTKLFQKVQVARDKYNVFVRSFMLHEYSGASIF
jgi:hypothetical protein